MAHTTQTPGEVVPSTTDRRPKQFLWGTEHVPLRTGAGTLFEKLGWINAQLNDARVFPLRDRPRFWSPEHMWLAPGQAVLVAAYFLFDSPEGLDSFVRELEASVPVTAELWISEPTMDSEEWNSRAALVLFDAFEPLHGSMSRLEVLRAVQHYLGWCHKKGSNSTHCWRHAKGGFTELVPVEAKTRWFAARQALLLPCGEPRRLVGRSFTCRTPCRDMLEFEL